MSGGKQTTELMILLLLFLVCAMCIGFGYRDAPLAALPSLAWASGRYFDSRGAVKTGAPIARR